MMRTTAITRFVKHKKMKENKKWFKREVTPSTNLYHVFRNRPGGRFYYAPMGDMAHGRIMYRGEIEKLIRIYYNVLHNE